MLLRVLVPSPISEAFALHVATLGVNLFHWAAICAQVMPPASAGVADAVKSDSVAQMFFVTKASQRGTPSVQQPAPIIAVIALELGLSFSSASWEVNLRDCPYRVEVAAHVVALSVKGFADCRTSMQGWRFPGRPHSLLASNALGVAHGLNMYASHTVGVPEQQGPAM